MPLDMWKNNNKQLIATKLNDKKTPSHVQKQLTKSNIGQKTVHFAKDKKQTLLVPNQRQYIKLWT